MACRYLLPVEQRNFHPGGTAFRIETFSPTDRCSLRPKVDNFGRTISVLRWVGSGGDPIGAADPCYGPNSAACPNNASSEAFRIAQEAH